MFADTSSSVGGVGDTCADTHIVIFFDPG